MRAPTRRAGGTGGERWLREEGEAIPGGPKSGTIMDKEVGGVQAPYPGRKVYPQEIRQLDKEIFFAKIQNSALTLSETPASQLIVLYPNMMGLGQ